MVYFTSRKRIWKTDHFRDTVGSGDMKKLLLLITASAIAAGAAGLPFIQDDFAKARAQALQRKLPIFVECWAPW